jgi:ubiquinone biosynthesis UbiH/UbiF/VisC/COQ6 family hydroxylase
MNYDVAIIGAGLSGLSLGLALSQAGRRVAVLDTRPAQTFDPLPEGSFDARIYAISPASARWLEGSRLWSALDATRTAPVYDMQIHGDAAVTLVPGLTLSAYRSGIGELCTIIEERELARVMASAARFATGLEFLRPVQVVAMSGDEDAARLSLADGRVITAQLVVGADGARSWARERAGIAVDTFDYHQTAVVANFACGKPHHNIASQWFRVEADGASGILAWLPLPGNRISMVWSVSTAFAQELMALEGQVLAERAALAGLNKLGAFACVGEPAAFPLRNQRARRLIGSRFALVADAAHVLHPLAGQGLNLGFGDCAALCAVLAGARDCGDPLALRTYERARKAALAEMHAVTHGIARLFSLDHPVARGLRNFGLNLVGRLPVIPRMIVRGAIRG